MGRTVWSVGTVVCIWCHSYLLSLVLCGWCCGCWSRYSLPRGAKRRMGNQVARVGNASHRKVESATAAGAGNGNHGANVTTSSTAAAVVSKSEPDHHNSHTQFFPIENLAKVQRPARSVSNRPQIVGCTLGALENRSGKTWGDTTSSVAKHFYSCLGERQKQSLSTRFFKLFSSY